MLAGEDFIVQFIAVTICMQKFTYQHFGLCVFAFNAAHVVATGCCIVYIGHNVNLHQCLKNYTIFALCS